MDFEDQLMGGVIDTTELSRNGHLDPSVLTLAPSLLSNATSTSPEIMRMAYGSTTNGDRTTFTRSPSRRQETKAPPVRQKAEALPYSTSVTGLVYDVRMRFHVEIKPEQNGGVHPEDPRRIWMIYSELVQAGLVDDADSPGFASQYVLGRIAARQATREEICAFHTQDHFDWVMGLTGDYISRYTTFLFIYVDSLQRRRMMISMTKGNQWTLSIFRKTHLFARGSRRVEQLRLVLPSCGTR